MEKPPLSFTAPVTPDLEELLRDGIAAAKAGNHPVARSLLLQATEYDPDAEIGWLWLAYSAESADEAIQYFRRTIELNPFNEHAKESLSKTLTKRGTSLASSGKNIEARESLMEATALYGGSESAWMWLALVAADSAEAEKCLKKVLGINPENQYAQDLLERLQNPAQTTTDEEADETPDPAFEPEWLPKTGNRAAAEHRITELLDDIYTSLHVMTGAEKIQAEVEAAKERVSELEELLMEVRDNLSEESMAREAAEARVAEITEQNKRILHEKDAEIAGARDEVRALEEKLAKLHETESWAQEIGSKWIEEADARKSAERRSESLSAELKRIESIMGEAETAMSDFNVRIEKEYEARARIELSREGAENREKAAIRAKEEAEARLHELEERLRQLESGSSPEVEPKKKSTLDSDYSPEVEKRKKSTLDSDYSSEVEKRKKSTLEPLDRQIDEIFSDRPTKPEPTTTPESKPEFSSLESFLPATSRIPILKDRPGLKVWTVGILIGLCLIVAAFSTWLLFRSG